MSDEIKRFIVNKFAKKILLEYLKKKGGDIKFTTNGYSINYDLYYINVLSELQKEGKIKIYEARTGNQFTRHIILLKQSHVKKVFAKTFGLIKYIVRNIFSIFYQKEG